MHFSIVKPAFELRAREPHTVAHYPSVMATANSKTLFAKSTATVVAFISDSFRSFR